MNNSERKSVFSDMETPQKSGERQEKPESNNAVADSVKSWARAGIFGLTLGLGILGVADNASAFETNVKNVSQTELKKAVSENDVMAVMQLLLEDLGYEYAGDDHKDGSVIEIVHGTDINLKETLIEYGEKVKAVLRKKGKKGKVKFKVRFAGEGKNMIIVIHGQTELDKAKMEGENDEMRMMELLIAELGYERIGDQSDMSVIEIVQEKDGEKTKDTLKRGGKDVRKALIERKMREDGMVVMPGDWKTYKLKEGVEYKVTHAWVNGKLMAAVLGKIKPKLNRHGSRNVKGESMDGGDVLSNISLSDTVTAKTRRQALRKAAKKKEMRLKDFKKKFQIKQSNKKGIWVIEIIIAQVAQNNTREAEDAKLPPVGIPDTQMELSNKIPHDIEDRVKYLTKRHLKSFEKCHAAELKRNDELNIGKIKISLLINTRGKVVRVKCTKNNEPLLNDRLVNCIEKTVKKWQFPRQREELEAHFPLLMGSVN